MKIAPIVDPHERRPSPKPMQVDLRKAFILGTVLWTIALVVCICCWQFGHNLWFRTSTVICASGVVIGLLLLVWEFFDRSDYRRLGK